MHTVLAIGLDENVRDSLEKLLESFGADVRTHTHLDAFIREMATADSGCILIDGDFLHVPHRAFLNALHEIGNTLPVLLLSSSNDPEFGNRDAQPGYAMVIRKPLVGEQLASRVASLFQPTPPTLAAP